MCTSIVLYVLSGFLVPNPASSDPVWLQEYALARQLGTEQQKPLAVFISSGTSGWEDVSEEGRLGKEVVRVLKENYVCLYVNTENRDGQRLAEALDIPQGPGIVITGAGGRLQAFRHEGELSNRQLARYLNRFADADEDVETTETVPTERRSYYPPPVFYYRPAPAFGGGGC